MDEFTSTANQETIIDIDSDFSSEASDFTNGGELPLQEELSNYDIISDNEETSQVIIDETEIAQDTGQQFADWGSTVFDDSTESDTIPGQSISNYDERESIRSTESPTGNAVTLQIPIERSGDAQTEDSTESDTDDGGSERGETVVYNLRGVEEEQDYQIILDSINENLELIYAKINNDDLENVKSELEEYILYKVDEDKVHTYYMQASTGLLGMILGGILVYAFIGRIR